MWLRRLSLQGFRNYEQLHIDFPSSLNIFVGHNAQGKTNLLESIYLLALGRSFRTAKDEDLIHWRGEFARVIAEVERLSGAVRVDILLPRAGTKEVRLGGEKLRRMTDLIGTVNAVVFSPDDLQLLKGAPALRRRFLDAEIAQLSGLYRHHFLRYQRVLRQRNNVLKAMRRGETNLSGMDPWDDQLVADGVYILAKRAETVRRLGLWAQNIYRELSGGEELTVEYRPFFAEDDEAPDESWEDHGFLHHRFYETIKRRRRDEHLRGVSLVGPQRDDVVFRINGADARSFASQGQQRSIVLATKLAELEFFREEAGEYPLLLLDDVMSELDDRRRDHFLRHVSGRINTFITTTNLRSFHRDVLERAATFRVEAGTVKSGLSPYDAV